MKDEIAIHNSYFSLAILLGGGLLMLSGCSVTPHPFTTKEHTQRVADDLIFIDKESVPLSVPLSLQEAIARGLLFNLDARQAMLEKTLQDDQLSLANYAMLPHLAASAGYNTRDKFSASTSISLLTHSESLQPSYSSQRDTVNADLSFTWNLLDFGLSYFQAKKQSDLALAAMERRRRVMNNMVKEIQGAYWQAITAQHFLPEIEKLQENIKQTLSDSQKIEAQKLQPPEASLEYRRTLTQIMIQIEHLHSEIATSQVQLASLIGLPPSTPITLADPSVSERALSVMEVPIESLQRYGLINRAELREEAYKQRGDEQDVNREMLKLLPGLSAMSALNYDSDHLLFYNDWRTVGAHATWDLMNVIQGPKAIETAKTQVEISRMRRLALTQAVMAQVSISYAQYLQDVKSYSLASQLSEIDVSLLKVANDAQMNSGTRFNYIQKSAAALASQLERDRSFTEAKIAYASLLVSVGYDLVPASTEAKDLESMTSIVDKAMTGLSGDILHGFISAPPPVAGTGS